MFNYNHYVPMLKGKRGEFGALCQLSLKTKPLITPLIDIPRISRNNENPKEALEMHLIKIADNIKSAWGSDRLVFIDLSDIDLIERTADGSHPVSYVFNILRNESIQAIPTTGFERDSAYNLAVAAVIKQDKNGVCIRILDDDMDSIAELNAGIAELLAYLSISRGNVHLLLDFKDIRNGDIGVVSRKAIRVINGLSGVLEWQTLTVAASGFPESLSSQKSNSIEKLERKELSLWKTFIREKTLKRVPSYGDYGIVHPILLDLDPRTIKPSAKIRYTLENQWLIIKGHSLKKDPKFKQYHELSKQLVTHKDYIGSGFSWGDDYVAKCAAKAVGSGNLETWVKVDTNHHLTFVSEQIANTVLP